MTNLQPIKCPNCEQEVIPHETIKQRWEDCLNMAKDLQVSEDNKIKVAINLFNEINDFIISENIAKDRMNTTRYIAQTKRDNIKAIKKEG